MTRCRKIAVGGISTRRMKRIWPQWTVVSGQTDTEAVYREVVGEGLAPPEENETGINGFTQYKLYDNFVGRDLLFN